MKLTKTQRIEILMMIGCGDKTRTQNEVCTLFNNKYPNREPISHSTVSKIEKKFREMGHVKDLPKGRRKPVSEDKRLDVLLDHSTVLRRFKKEKWHPYKVSLVHELCEYDFDRRIEFCETIMEKDNRDPMFLSKVLFSTFLLNVHVNRQNCRYWATNNPHWMLEYGTQYPEKVNVWAGIIGDRIIGPYFFEETLTGARYLEFLQNSLLPEFTNLFLSFAPHYMIVMHQKDIK